MRYIKILGLAVVAAIAVTAFVGAGTAAANVVCKENKTPCGANDYGVGSIIKATAVNPVLTAFPEITCEHSETEIEVTNTGSSTTNATGIIKKFTFTGNCKESLFGLGCTTSVEGLPYHAEVLGSGASASITVKGGTGGGNPRARVVCGGFISCTLAKTDLTFGISSGNPATVLANEEELEIESGGFGCPSEAFLDADYISTTGAAWVVAS